MIFIIFVLSLILWWIAKNSFLKLSLWPLLLNAPTMLKYQQNEWKTIKRYNIYTKILVYSKYTLLQTKWGFIQRIQYKWIDKCRKTTTQNIDILTLINSPQLELVCPQTKPNKLQNKKAITKESWINKQCMVQIKTYTQSKYLPQSYNDNM